MADEQHKWLTRETAERPLRGESREAVAASGRDQAEQLGKALGALSAEAAPAAGELPGEQAALAAFRKAREAAEAERTAAALGDGTPGKNSRTARGSDGGLVRIGTQARTGIRSGRPRWARPVRLALAAAVAAGTLGGVAVAAGSGVLQLPFHREPGPAASVSAQNSGEPLTSPSPRSSQGTAPGSGTPSAGTSGSAGADPSRNAAGRGKDKDKGKGAKPGSGDPSGNAGTWWKGAAAACRDIRDGRELGLDRRRVLEGLAGGSARVAKYCKAVLEADQSASGGKGESGDGDGGKDSGSGKDKGDGKGEGDGQGGDDDGHRGGHGGGHGGRHRGDSVPPAPATFGPLSPSRKTPTPPAPTPTPTYTAL